MTLPTRQRWLAADEWFDDYIRRLVDSPRRVRGLKLDLREHPWDHKIRVEREYDAETENLRRFIAGQKENAA
jgi:hypothetical protein